MTSSFLLYGATGYTGELIARAAVQRGLRPILAGRRRDALAQLAAELHLEYRVFAVQQVAEAEAALSDMTVLLNCAGPFDHTAAPLAQLCVRSHTHYLDLAGEVPEFEEVARFDEVARAAQVMLLPGVGVGVVPSDCLALALKERLPLAQELSLVMYPLGGASRGTLQSMLRDLQRSGVIRRQKQLVPARAASESRRVRFNQHEHIAVLNPWRADVFTAYYSTGIPNIKTYTVFPTALSRFMQISPSLGWLLRSQWVQRMLQSALGRQPSGPSEDQRARGRTLFLGEVVDASGQKVTAELSGPEGYDFSVITALACIERIFAGDVQAGFHTPAQIFGSNLIRQLPGVALVEGTISTSNVG